jgi:hypothetical protein
VEANPEFAALARDWWDYWRRSRGPRDERKALSLGQPPAVQVAHGVIERRVKDGGRPAVELLVALNDAGPPDDDGVTVGTGPLEDLIHEHGDVVIDDLVEFARTVPTFALALSHVWLESGHLSKTTTERLMPWISAAAD